MIKVVITARNVTDIDPSAKANLEKAGFLVEEYPHAHQLSSEELVKLLQDADVVLAGLEKYNRGLLNQLPSLKLIARRGAGIDNIDLVAAKDFNIQITRTEGLVGAAVAELVMGYLLEDARKVSEHNQIMKQGQWTRMLTEGLNGKTLGLVGFGSIAKETALRANPFGMKVQCYYRHRDEMAEKAYSTTYVDFETLLRTSDYISINTPLTEETKSLFNSSVFALMKPTSILINTARSGIINAKDLVTALNEKQIRGAYIDVYDHEPCTASPFHEYDNVFLTPHLGTFTKETFISMNNRCAEQIIEFFKHFHSS